MNFRNFYIPRKKNVDLSCVNKPMFETMRDEEIFKYNKLNEQFAKILTGFKFAGDGLRAETKEIDFDKIIDNIKESGKNNKTILGKITKLKEKYRNLKEISINEELVKSDEMLLTEGFFDKYPDLR